ncbi:MAG: tRNA (guanosine(46)-N7)-methyltransferase TrmB [Deltaproteobacteria bacterium]|nr:MAG: tRNA (guanosine(46)-N7)-methyltransferase TrmB [Deltaproteobacteria bacterium]
MALRGRPTPQPEHGEDRPRFKDRAAEEYANPEANPFVRSHREFGHPLLPASEAWKWHGRWPELFEREAPLWLEIGCGNGFFLRDVAMAHPEANLVGIEIRYKRTVICAKKLTKAGVNNAVICRYHAAFLDDLFEEGSLERIFVNHPDPWPKERHEKNRLISRWFLEDVVRLLKPGGVFQLKSDFPPNVERVEALLTSDGEDNPAPRLPLRITGMSEDIARDGAPWPDDVLTNYQQKMAVRGKRVLGIELIRE